MDKDWKQAHARFDQWWQTIKDKGYGGIYRIPDNPGGMIPFYLVAHEAWMMAYHWTRGNVK